MTHAGEVFYIYVGFTALLMCIILGRMAPSDLGHPTTTTHYVPAGLSPLKDETFYWSKFNQTILLHVALVPISCKF